MSDIRVETNDQQIIVNPATQSITIEQGGPPGPPGVPGAALLNPDTPIVLTYLGGQWPDADVASNVRVIWIQPNVGGPAPPTGGRPGTEPYDLVFIRQEP